MSSTNDITGDTLKSKTSKAYRDNYDAVFKDKERPRPLQQPFEGMVGDVDEAVRWGEPYRSSN
jgi:hypothetical protein